jgi:HlyD family secretion protein
VLPVVLLFVVLFLALGGTAAVILVPQFLKGAAGDAETAEAAAKASPESVAALGRLEPAGGVFDVGGPTGLTIERMLVREGDSVERGADLAYLSSYNALQAEYEAALTALEEATSQLETTMEYAAALVKEAQVGVQQVGTPLDLEVEAVEAEIELLRAHRAVAVEDREKLEDLGDNANSSQLSRAKLVEQRADRDLESALKRLDQLRESIKPRREQAQAALHTAITNEARMRNSISIQSAKKNVDRAKAQLEQAIVRAPREGKVLRILVREGATLTGRPMLQMGDTSDMYALAEVYETDIRHVDEGQSAIIKSAALPEDLEGEVEEVLWTVARNSMRDINPTAPEDLRIVQVRIRINDDDVSDQRELLEKLINLQVHIVIQVD